MRVLPSSGVESPQASRLPECRLSEPGESYASRREGARARIHVPTHPVRGVPAPMSVGLRRIEHMIEALAQAQEAGGVEDLTASELLSALRERRASEDRAAADQLDLAARWADLHPPESIHSAAAFTVPGCEHEEPIAGSGCPLVAEFCIAELGAVLGISSTAAKKLIGHALELRHRLPRLWAQVHAGRVPAWRARLVAEATIHTSPALTMDAARWVDSQVAAVAGRVGTAQLDRLVAETIKRFELAVADPAADPEDGYLSVDPRHVTVHRDDVHYAGTLHLEADLDIADALDLDGALAHGAALQKSLGSTETLDVRRAKALGDLARTQTALDLFSQGHTGATDQDGLPAAREVVVHAHFDATVVGEQTVFGPTGRIGARPATGPARPDQELVRRLPDEGDHQARHRLATPSSRHPAYETPDRIREQVVLRDRTCVFPWCTRPARRCDVDHIVEHDHDAQPRADPNPAPPRPRTSPRSVATTTGSRPSPPGTTAWPHQVPSSGPAPTATDYRRDRTGTTRIDEPRAARPTLTPPHTPPRNHPAGIQPRLGSGLRTVLGRMGTWTRPRSSRSWPRASM